jgi:hypothetical protein
MQAELVLREVHQDPEAVAVHLALQHAAGRARGWARVGLAKLHAAQVAIVEEDLDAVDTAARGEDDLREAS